MDAQAVAFFVAGLAQPFLQEIVQRERLSGNAAHYATLAFSALLALLAVYITGGFSGAAAPRFTLLDPSPLLGFLVVKAAPIYLLSQVVFKQFKVGPLAA